MKMVYLKLKMGVRTSIVDHVTILNRGKYEIEILFLLGSIT